MDYVQLSTDHLAEELVTQRHTKGLLLPPTKDNGSGYGQDGAGSLSGAREDRGTSALMPAGVDGELSEAQGR